MNTYSFNYGGIKATGNTAVGGVTGTFIPTTPFRCSETTGRFKIVSELVNGVPCKTLQATTAGRVNLDLRALTSGPGNLTGFGEWTFWFYRTGVSNTIIVNYISKEIGTYNTTGNETYSVAFDSTEQVNCFRGNGAGAVTNMALSASSYFADSTWYRFRITRDVLGVFTYYITGGAFTTETRFAVFTGANPTTANLTYLAGNYLTIDLGTNDKILLASADGTMGFSHKMIA